MPASSAARTLLVAGLVTVFVGGGTYGASHLADARAATAATTATTSTASVVAKAPARGTALAVLATLRVKGRAPMTGYLRTARFGAAWLDVDRNGCDTRDDVLRRDLRQVVGSRCTVRSGVLTDPYTRSTIRFVRGEGTSTAVQIDHVVALGDAWRTGAQQLTQAKRIDLANDPINLFAVDGPTNAQKSDGDAATWLPPNTAFRCTYVAHQVGVKAAYGLWVTAPEKAAMLRILTTCPTTKAPTSTVARLVPARGGATGDGSAKGTPKASPIASAPAASAGVVHPGAYCSPAGATGRTAAGTAMTCRSPATDTRERWRAAA